MKINRGFTRYNSISGFAPILILLIILALGTVGFASYKFGGNKISVPVTILPTLTTDPISDQTVNWKTYTNTEYGFSFNYPSSWKIMELGSTYRKTVLILDLQKEDPRFSNCDSHGPCENSAHIGLNIGLVDTPVADFEEVFWGIGYPKERIINTTINSVEAVQAFNTKSSLYPRGTLYKINSKLQLNATSEFFNYNDPTNSNAYSKITIDEINQILSTFKFTENDKELVPADSDSPAAGVCPKENDVIVNIIIAHDNVPQPRCVIVSGSQFLKITNNSNNALPLSVGEYEVKIAPNSFYKFPESLGSFLAPGVHNIGGEVWLQ